MASLQTLTAVKAERRIEIGGGMTVIPAAQLGWRHEYLDAQAGTTATLAAIPDAPFTVRTAQVGRDAAVLGLRATLETSRRISAYANYTGAVNSGSNAQTVSAGLRFAW
jgi:subtilase-type serine protease